MDDTDLLARSVWQWRAPSAAVRAFVGNHVLQAHAEVSVLRALRAEVVRGIEEVEPRLPSGSPGGLALARTKAILLGRLDTRISLRRGQSAPQVPHDAWEPSDSELSVIRVDVRQYDYIRCVWCGVKRVMKEDKGIVSGHLKDHDMKDGVLVERFGCPMFQALHDRGLVKAGATRTSTMSTSTTGGYSARSARSKARSGSGAPP